MTLKQTIKHCSKFTNYKIFSAICRNETCKDVYFFVKKSKQFCSRRCAYQRGMYKYCAKCFTRMWKTDYDIKPGNRLFCSRKCQNEFRIKSNNPNWKNGSYINVDGYKVALNNGIYEPHKKYRKEHRMVMEKIIGRQLKSFESVHHKNGVRSDNRPDNLELWTMRKDPPGQRINDILKFIKDNYHNEYMALFERKIASNSIVLGND